MNSDELTEAHNVLSTIVGAQSTMIADGDDALDRINASVDAFAHAGFTATQLHQLLAVAVDRLAAARHYSGRLG